MAGIPMEHGLILAAILFVLGLVGLMLRRNMLFVLMSLEVMLNAAALAFVVGATAFTGVFNITGGLRATQELIRALDMQPWMLVAVMLAIIFVLGAFLDWTGIVLLSFPIFLPIVQEMPDVSLLWFVVLMAVVLQTSFLTPPFGYALFYLRAIAPREVRTGAIIRGVLPFIVLILIMCVLVALFPSLVTWLPDVLYSN